MGEEKKDASRLGSAESWRELFVDKPDPTAVEIARVHEDAETKRVRIRERSSFWLDRGSQQLAAFAILVIFGAAAFMTHSITNMHRPIITAPSEPPPAPESPKSCTDSITRVSRATGTLGCPPGRKFELKKEDDNYELVVCTCPHGDAVGEPGPTEQERRGHVEVETPKPPNPQKTVSETVLGTACPCPHFEDDAGLLVEPWWNPDGGLSMNPRIANDSCECRDEQELLRIANKGKK